MVEAKSVARVDLTLKILLLSAQFSTSVAKMSSGRCPKDSLARQLAETSKEKDHSRMSRGMTHFRRRVLIRMSSECLIQRMICS